MSKLDAELYSLLSNNPSVEWYDLSGTKRLELMDLMAEENIDAIADLIIDTSVHNYIDLLAARYNSKIKGCELCDQIVCQFGKDVEYCTAKYCTRYFNANRYRYKKLSNFTQKFDIPLDEEGKAKG